MQVILVVSLVLSQRINAVLRSVLGISTGFPRLRHLGSLCKQTAPLGARLHFFHPLHLRPLLPRRYREPRAVVSQ
jgi:hypothetical protein